MMKNTLTKTTYTMLTPETKTPPTVIFSQTSLKWIKNLIKAHSGEVGFYGIVDEKEDYVFYVRDIFYPKQQLVTAATCEISIEGGTMVAEWLINHDRSDDVGKMSLWGHSHHSMGVEPSGQDNSQALELIKTNGHYLLRVIVNNEGYMNVSFFDPVKGIRFDHVKWDEEKIDGDALAAERVANISSVMAEDIPPKEKMEKIRLLSSEDLEEKKIIEKIEALKKVNIPEPKTTHYSSGTHYPHGFHASEFHHHGDYEPYGTSYHNDTTKPNNNIIHHGKGNGRQLSFLTDFGFQSRKNRNKNKINKHNDNPNIKTFLDDSHAEVNKMMNGFEEVGGGF